MTQGCRLGFESGQAKWPGVRGPPRPPAGSRGSAPVGGQGGEAPLKLKAFLHLKGEFCMLEVAETKPCRLQI